MKITTIPMGAAPGTTLSEGPSPDRLARAKAIAAGKTPQEQPVEAPAAPEVNPRKITMRTNASPLESSPPPAGDEVEQPEAAPEATEESATNDEGVEATPATEETKPLSPQFAALAKQRRALQVKERELADREKALEGRANGSDVLTRLKQNPLGVLQEAGVTYEQLTEAVLNGQANPEIQALKEEIKALKEGVDKNLSERDAQVEQQVLKEMRREVDRLTFSGDDFEAIRATKSQQDVVDLIHRTFKETGEVLSETEACKQVEEQLLSELLPLTALSKVKAKLNPAAPPTQQPHPQGMRTLTNRDSSRPPVSAKQRAIAAFHGTLRK